MRESAVTIAMMGENHPATRLKYAFAAVAKLHDVNFFYFRPQDVDCASRTIRGYALEREEWISRTFDYPDAIYDGVARRGKLYEEAYRALADIPMTTDKPVKAGNKLVTNQLLLEHGTFADYVIPSVRITQVGQVFDWLENYPEVIIKPIKGMQGRRICYVRRSEDGYIVTQDRETTFYFRRQFVEWVKRTALSPGVPCLIQPYIRSVTKNGSPFDIRANVAMDGEGQWRVVRIIPRIGIRTGVISNLSAGGYTGSLKHFYAKELGGSESEYRHFERQLQQFALSFAPHLQGLMEHRIHAMGLDLGLDEHGKLWLFEANFNRLGTDFQELDFARCLVPYTIHLARKHQRATILA